MTVFPSSRRVRGACAGILLLVASLFADPVPIPVNGVASDVVYLAAGLSSGLAAGMRGELRAQDGRRAEVEVLYVSAGRASCRVSPAGAELRMGDEIWFDLPVPARPAEDSTNVQVEATAPLPPAAVAAITRAANAHGLRLQGWWRGDVVLSDPEREASTVARQSLGLRAGMAQWRQVNLSLQLRHRSQWGEQATMEGWLDELSLSGPTPGGRLRWEAGRMSDGRNALTGPLDGVLIEGIPGTRLGWGLSAGSRPAAPDQASGRATGAGARLRWQDKSTPLTSDLKTRLERDGNGLATAGASWSNQLRFLSRGRLEHWFRAEYSEATDWSRAESRFSSTRVRWQGEAWQVEGRHQLNRWPAKAPDDLQAGPPLEDRRSRQLALALSRQLRGTWMQLQVRGRGERLDGDMERLAEVGLSRTRPDRLVNRASLNAQVLLGPRDDGQDLELRVSAAPDRLPEIELGLRTWRQQRGVESWSGLSGSLHARGRVWSGLRWEAGGLLQRAEGEWRRELRVGLRGDLRLRPDQRTSP